jgi:hypothetical protein
LRNRILVGAAMTLCAIGLSAVPASANGGGGSTKCNSTINGGTISSNLNVGNNAVCVLNGVTVNGNVSVAKNAYFEANGGTINGNVSAYKALTVYIHGGTHVNGNVANASSAQLFVFNSTVSKSIGAVNDVAPGYGHFQVCGSTVSREIGAGLVGPDVLIGDPAASCGGNTAGSIVVANDSATSELFVIGNTVNNGDLGVWGNTGPGPKQVNGNTVSKGDLLCLSNSSPFDGSGNGAVGDLMGSCSASSVTGNDPDE